MTFYIPYGKRLHNYGKSPCSSGKLTINGPFFRSYVSLPADIGNVVTPTDKIIFFRGVGIPPTRNGEEEQPIIKRISSPITLFGRCAEDKANFWSVYWFFKNQL